MRRVDRSRSLLRLRVYVVLTVAVIGLFGCVTPPPSVPGSPVPRVIVTPERRDLGVVGLGEDAVAEFVVRNDGGAPLALTAPVLPRGTSVEGLVSEVPAGEAVRLRFRIDTLNANAEPRQDWTLITNDPDRPRVEVPVTLDVQPFLVVRPGRIRYITVQHERDGVLTQTIGAVDGATFRVRSVQSPVAFLRVSFHEAAEAERRPDLKGSQWRVVTTLPADAPVGALSGLIVVHTDHPRQKRAFIGLSGFVRPMLVATPAEARLGEVDRRRSRPLQLLLKNFAEELIEVTGVSTDVSAVTVEIEPIEPGRTWRLRLVPISDAPLGAFGGTVTIRTASPKVPTFDIPLSGRLVESPGNP
jgi:hypothetical protein